MIAPVWMCARAGLRRGWRALLALSLIVGVFGGAVIAAAAAARRTDTVVDRLAAVAREPHVYAPIFAEGPIAPIAADEIRTIPEVEAAVELRELRVAGSISVVGTLDPRIGVTLARPNVRDGRLARSSALDEVVVNHLVTERFGVRVGDRLPIDFAPPGAYSESGPFAFQGVGEDPPEAPHLKMTFTVVGIVVSSGDLVAAAEPTALVTPAFMRAHPDLGYDSFAMVWLRRGDADLVAFRRGVTALAAGRPVFLVEARVDVAQVRRSFHLQAVSLWLLAAAVALATLMVFSQTLARQIFLDSSEYPTLGALGLTQRQLAALGMVRTAIAAGIGAVTAGGLAFALSPAAPFGLARLAEPEPGARFDAASILGGSGAIVAAVLILGLLPSWRTTRARPAGGADELRRARPSALADLLSRVFRRPGPAIGARMALESGRGSTAAPVRTTIAGIIIGLAAFTAALTVAASMDHLLGTPRLYGWSWDAGVGGGDEDVTARISEVAGLEAIAVGADFLPLEIGGAPVVGMAMGSIRGTIAPTILEGRAPAGPEETAVGRTTLREIGARVGDMIDVRVQGVEASTLSMHIVGIGVFPRVDDSGSIGEGVFVTADGMRKLFPPAPTANAFVRFSPGAEPAALAALREIFGDEGVQLASPPSSVVDFGRVSSMPLILAGLLGALAAGTLAHGLITTVRRRRRDLAILKCLGFARAQVRGAVAWQAMTIAVLTLLVSLPLGIAAGRWLWSVLAHSGGFVVEPATPVTGALITMPAAIILANIVAALPARAAARMRPSTVLRKE